MKKEIKKLSLNKSTISNLNYSSLRGGYLIQSLNTKSCWNNNIQTNTHGCTDPKSIEASLGSQQGCPSGMSFGLNTQCVQRDTLNLKKCLG